MFQFEAVEHDDLSSYLILDSLPKRPQSCLAKKKNNH